MPATSTAIHASVQCDVLVCCSATAGAAAGALMFACSEDPLHALQVTACAPWTSLDA